MNIESKSKTFYYFLLFWIIIIYINYSTLKSLKNAVGKIRHQIEIAGQLIKKMDAFIEKEQSSQINNKKPLRIRVNTTDEAVGILKNFFISSLKKGDKIQFEYDNGDIILIECTKLHH